MKRIKVNNSFKYLDDDPKLLEKSNAVTVVEDSEKPCKIIL